MKNVYLLITDTFNSNGEFIFTCTGCVYSSLKKAVAALNNIINIHGGTVELLKNNTYRAIYENINDDGTTLKHKTYILKKSIL